VAFGLCLEVIGTVDLEGAASEVSADWVKTNSAVGLGTGQSEPDTLALGKTVAASGAMGVLCQTIDDLLRFVFEPDLQGLGVRGLKEKHAGDMVEMVLDLF
jgi:hypothetical protein